MISKLVGAMGVDSVVGHFVDKNLKDTVNEPKVGSIVYTGLLADAMEHTGVYVGDGKIIELNNKGHIVEVSAEEFIEGGTGINIYVSAQGKHPVGSSLIAERAMRFEREVSVKEYNLLFDNCHMFTAACILDELDNSYSFLWMVKDLAKQALGADQWLVWNTAAAGDDSADFEVSEQRLRQLEQQLRQVHEQDRCLWDDIKAYTKLVQEHAENGPASWFYTTDSRLESYQRRSDELQQIDMVNTRKQNDLTAEAKQLEQQIETLKARLVAVD